MKKNNNNIYTSLEIGSAKIICLIARMTEYNSLEITGIGHCRTSGYKAGVITDLKALEKSILKALEQAEQQAGIRVEQVILSCKGLNFNSEIYSETFKLDNKPLTDKDISVFREQIVNNYKRQANEVIHAIPLDYDLDVNIGIKNPIGMIGKELKARFNIVYAKESSLINLVNCISNCHLVIKDILFGPIAQSLATLSNEDKELGSIFIDFGARETCMLVYMNGFLSKIINLPIGGYHITYDIASCLEVSMEDAERVKTLWGSANLGGDDKNIKINGKNFSNLLLNEIIFSRAEEIIQLLYENLQKYNFDNKLKKIYIAGGTSKLSGLQDLTQKIFDKPAFIARLIEDNVKASKEIKEDTIYLGSLSILQLAFKEQLNIISKLKNKSQNSMLKRTLKWLQENF